MLFAILAQDRKGTEDARQTQREGHLAHFQSHKGKIALAGPLTSDDGRSVGSLVIFEAESEAEAGAFIRADPFYVAGVWDEPVIARIRGSIFDPEKFT